MDDNQQQSEMEAMNSMPLLTPVSDGEVFIPEEPADLSQKRKDDEMDSFYGSDKEVDEAVEFSHTDSSSSSSSASESEVEPESKSELRTGETEAESVSQTVIFLLETILLMKPLNLCLRQRLATILHD